MASVGEEVDRIEIFPERDATAVVVDDFRHWAVREREELEGDTDASQVIPMKRLRDLDDAAIPHRFFGRSGVRVGLGPGAVVESGGFTMGKVTSVDTPRSARERLQLLDAIEGGLLRWRELHGGGTDKMCL